MEFLRNLFGVDNKLPTGNKSAADFLEHNGELINQVVRDIVEPFLNPSTASGTDTESDLSYTLKLMDADTCGQMAFYLSKNMSEMIKTYDISGFGGPINTIAPGTKSITEANIQTPTGMVSRKQICDRLAGHYVTIINLIGAILTGINPQTNMALSRMNSLYTLVDGTTDTFRVNICTKEGKQAVKASLLDEPGVKEFMGLYLFHLLSVSESPADKDRVMREYQNLVRKLIDEDRTVAMPREIPQSVNTESAPVNTQQGQLTPVTTEQVVEQPAQVTEQPAQVAEQPQQTGIFGNISEKLSSGFSQLLSNNSVPTQPKSVSSSVESQTSSSNSSSSGSSSNSSSGYSPLDSIKLHKQTEINRLNAELIQERDIDKQKTLREKIEGLLSDLRSSENSSNSDSSSSSSSSSGSSHGRTHGSSSRSSSSRSSSSRSSSSRSSSSRSSSSLSSSSSGSSSRYSSSKSNSSRRHYGGGEVSSLSADASVARFITFMEKYIHENPNDKRTIMRNVLTLFKGGHFKQPDISRIKTLCKNADADGKEITLKTSPGNMYLKQYTDNWLEMRHKYMKSVGDLVDILENQILMTNTKTQKMEVRNISSRELADLETKTRTILADMYSTAHQHYIVGVNALYDYYHDITSGVPAY